MNSSSTEGNRPHRKDAVRSRKPHFTDKSQAPHFHGSDYKQRIKVLSKDNKELTTALQNTRSDLADKEKVLDNVKSAEAIMIKLHSSMKSFLEDFEQVLCLLNTNNTNWPVSGSLLQPRNEFRKEKKVMPEISTGKTCMIVKEIVAKEVESFDISENDEGSTVKNHHVSADQVTKVSNGTAEESTSKSLPNGVVDKSTKKRKCSSNNSEQPASKRNKSILDERSREESSNHILRHSLKMPSRKRSFLSKTEKKTNGEESTAAESKNEENMYTSTSVKFAKTQKKKSQLRSAADKIKDDKYEQVESGSENEMKNTVSRNSSSSRRTGSVDDASLCKTFVAELDTEHIKVETSCQNTIRLSKMSKRKTLPNKRKGIKSQSEQGAEKSQSEELKSASFSIKSLKMTRRGSQAESTSNKSKNDNLKIQNPDFVKKKKKHGQIVSEKAVNRNTETLKERTVVSANDAFQNETLISVRKLSLNKLFVKCSDVLIDPSFESDPFVSKFKKNSLMNYKDNKEKISSIKIDNEDEHLDTEDINVSSKQAPLFHNESDVIETKKNVSTNNSASWRRKGKHRANRLDDSSEDESSSIKTDNEDEHLDTEDISVSSKQAPLFHNESDVIETKKTVSTNNSASWRRKGKHRANRLDDSSEDEFPLNQLNASKKKDVSSTTGNLSDLDTERFDLTAVGQDAKSKEKFNVDKADLSEDRAGKAKFNTDKFKATDADSEDDEHENESGTVKENREKQADEQSEKIVCQEKLRVEEVKSTPFSAKSLRMQRRDSQKESTADESKSELKIENLATVKKKKRHQIESEKTPNNTKNSKKERSTKKPVSVDYVVQNGSVTSESKTSLNKVIVKCCDILVDPSFESDPFVKKFKKDNLLNYNSSRNYEGSCKGKTYEIHAEIHAEPVSSKNLDCKDKNSVMKDINESSKQVPSTSYESDSVKTKNAVSRYGSTSRRGKCIASNMDDSLPDETSLTQPNSSGKDDVFSTIVELSDLDSEMSDSTSVDQMNKPKKEFNENKTDLNENKICEIESDADETKGIDANSKDKEENENDSESCVVKKNEQRSASNHCTSFFYKSALERKEPASLKQTLQNKREELDNREKLTAEESESEDLRPTLFSVESIKKPRRGSQAESSTDESKNDKLRIVNPASVKEIKAHSQIKCKKIANSNTEISKNGKVLSAYDAFQDETLISESKSSLNNLFVKCVDVLIDPSFESDPVISRFKKDNFLNYDSSKDDEGSIKGEFYEIVDEDDEEIEFSENPDSEDEHLGTEDIECSKQEPSITYESDSIETKTAVPRNYSTSRNSRDIALSVDKLSQDESSLNQLNAFEKEDFNSTTDKLSDLNSEKFYSTDVCQGDKSEKEYNENNAELKRNEVSETESNVDDTKAADSNSKDEENKNELKSSIVKKNKNKEDSNEVSEIVSKADEAKFIDAVSKEENENRSESSMDKGNSDEANIKEVKVAETESNADADKATDTNSKDKEENENK